MVQDTGVDAFEQLLMSRNDERKMGSEMVNILIASEVTGWVTEVARFPSGRRWRKHHKHS